MVNQILPQGSKLQNGTFVVGKVLGQGGFSITYQGADISLERYVAIKEFFPTECVRNGQQVFPVNSSKYTDTKARFLEEARILAHFSHNNIVNILTTFEENNTVYIVMEFLKGRTLQFLVEERGAIPEGEAVDYISQICDALSIVHQINVIHRDIKPENIVLCDEKRVILIDFGIHKKIETTRNHKTQQLALDTNLGTEGFAPPEQYLQHTPSDKFTDIYALGATLYFLVTGRAPISAPERAMGAALLSPQKLNPLVSSTVNFAILSAMELKSDLRPQTTQDFVNLLCSTAKPAFISSPNATSSNVVPPKAFNRVKGRGYCPICGGANSHSDLACGYCGARLPWAAQPSLTTSPSIKSSAPTLTPSPALGPSPTVMVASGAWHSHSPGVNFSEYSAECPNCSVINRLPYINSPNSVVQCHQCNQQFTVPGLKISMRSVRGHRRPLNWFDKTMMLLFLVVALAGLFFVGVFVGLIFCFILSSIVGSDLGPLTEIVSFSCGFGAAGWFLKKCIEDKTWVVIFER